ncbi:tubulin-like doman-containing protein [Deinococcus navajonensis]|uniref:Tubulin-like doman-containing protein n=1 Tax=Deinococcus navajonensis TaxID=309884 RepID=A0ABV8XNI3_9DEIO
MIPTHTLKRTVLIGLGGTGKDALLHAKRKYIETFGEVPPLVSFLVIDTTNDNASSIPATRPDGSVEDVKLKASELLHIVARGASSLPKVNDEIREWWPAKASLKSNILSGAGQVRALGRLALFANARLVYDTLRNTLASARDYANVRTGADARAIYESMSPNLTVCVAGSIAGGTGSGTFLDVALILRDLLSDEDQLFGYLVLPDIFTPNPGTQNVEPNAYGALLELDHLMTRDDTWSYPFGGRRITVRKKPFDMAFLVNRQNRAGKTFNDKENLSELIGMGMFLAGGPLGKEQADIFDNIVVQLTEGQGKFYGKTAHYAGFGAAELQFEPGSLDAQRSARTLQDALTFLSATTRTPALKLPLLDVPAAPEDAGNLRFEVPGVHEEAGRWSAIAADLRAAITSTRGARLRERQHELTALETALESELQSLFAQGYTFSDLVAALNAVHSDLNKRIAAQEATSETLRQGLDDQLEKTGRNVESNAQAQKPQGGFLRKAAEVSPVLNRRGLDRMALAAVTVGDASASAEQLRLLAQRIVARRDRLSESRERLSRWFTDRLAQQGRTVHGPRTENRPFTLVVPPAYLPQTALKQSHDPEQAAALLRALTLPALEQPQPAGVLQAAFQSQQAADLRGWLSGAVTQAPGTPQRSEVERTFRELDAISAPCWDYQDAWVSNPAVGHLEQLNILGVENRRDAHPVFHPTIQDVFAGHLHKFQTVSTGDPQRVILYKIEAAIPAFALANAQVYREKYMMQRDNASYHIHREWEALPDLAPLPDQAEAMDLWVRARITGRVRVKDGRYQYASDREGSERWYDLGRNVPDAFSALGSNFFLFKELERLVEQLWQAQPEHTVQQNLERFVAASRKLADDAERSAAERDVFERQFGSAQALLDRVRRGQAFQIPDDFEPVTY